MASTRILYGYWRSTAAYRVRIALAHKELSYDNRSVHLIKDGGQQKAADYTEINPQQLVPHFQDGDLAINQSMAILEYLEEVYPEKPLLPKSSEERAAIRAFCQEIVSDIHPLNNLRVLQYLKTALDVSEEEKLSWYRHWIARGFSALEQRLNKSRAARDSFCFGDQLTLADLCLVPQMYNARRFDCPLDEFPTLRAIENHCLELPAFQSALPENQADAQV